MRFPLIAVLANDAGQVQRCRFDLQSKFLPYLAARAGVRRFSRFGVELSSARTPKAAIRLLRPMHQQHFIAVIEAVEQRSDSILHLPLEQRKLAGARSQAPRYGSYARPCRA